MKFNIEKEVEQLFEAAPSYAARSFDTRYEPREPEYTYIIRKWLQDPKSFAKVANPEDYVEGAGKWFVKALRLWYAKNKTSPTHDAFHRLTTNLLMKGMPRYLLTDVMSLIDKLVPAGKNDTGEMVTESDAPIAWKHADGSCQCHSCAKRRFGNRLMNYRSVGVSPVYDEEGDLEEGMRGKLTCRTCKKPLGSAAATPEIPEKKKKPTKKMLEKCGKKDKNKLKEAIDVIRSPDMQTRERARVSRSNDGKGWFRATPKDEEGRARFKNQHFSTLAGANSFVNDPERNGGIKWDIKHISSFDEANEPPEDKEEDFDINDILDGETGDEQAPEVSNTSDEVQGNPDDDGEAGDNAAWSPKKGMPGIGMNLALQKEVENGYQWRLDFIERGVPMTARIDGEVTTSAEEMLSIIVSEYKKFQSRVENILSGF